MQFIKKLVILNGKAGRATLILEKNGFGVWGKLNLFDALTTDCKLVIISGDMFVKSVEKGKSVFTFELGEVNYGEIHVALVSDKVVMYGSNCAKKMSESEIMSALKSRGEAIKRQADFVTFSDTSRNAVDYFKEIAPPRYNDFALAEKNYYPAYVKFGQEAATNDEKQNRAVNESEVKSDGEAAGKTENRKPEKTENMSKPALPCSLERQFLLRMQFDAGEGRRVAATKESVCEFSEQKSETQKDNAVKSQERHILNSLKTDAFQAAKPVGRRATYFERSSAQIQKLLSSNERFTVAERLIPGSKFVKINYDGRRYYIVGALGEDYICYGVPASYSAVPPEPMCDYAKWLPLSPDKPTGDGFWMMYQDGVTGETLKNR